MYEASFGLKRRPFAATPDATCFLSAGPIQAALDELVVCVEQGQGIGILTAPAGTGKTLLCERLRLELDQRFETVFLRHASFLTRRALLQTILCELNHSYHHPSEQELRLELLPAIRALTPKREALVLICDEAHHLSDSLLEELRILADFAESGRPLVRLVLAGQLSLEEKLAAPGLEAFNQRIRAQVSLSPFDHAGSLDYIDYRLTWAGGRTDEVFSPAALEVISKASDGIPRCINQLSDHTLLLAFVAEEKPAGEELVREALTDLRQLPLHWNEPIASVASDALPNRTVDYSGSVHESRSHSPRYSDTLKDSHPSPGIEINAAIGPLTRSIEWSSVEFEAAIPESVSHTIPTRESTSPAPLNRIEADSDDWRQTVESFEPQPRLTSLASTVIDDQAASTSFEIDDRHHASVTHRLQFHDLLQDAYAAAGQSAMASTDTETVAVAEGTSSSTGFESATHLSLEDRRTISVDHVETLPDSLTQAPTGKPAIVEYEEIIVDRYAAIDAGLAPPQSVPFDTEIETEVRFRLSDSHDSSELELSEPVDLDPVSRLHDDSVLARDEADIDHHLSCDDWPEAGWSGRGPEMATPTGISETASPDTVNPTLPNAESWIDDSQIAASVQFIDPMCEALGEEQPVSLLDDKDAVLEIMDDSIRNLLESPSDQVERLADEVYSLGQALHPTGVLSSNSQSLLTALRREVVEFGSHSASEVNHSTVSMPLTENWQSVETDPGHPLSEARPFRYLFSLLRRKQQGLA